MESVQTVTIDVPFTIRKRGGRKQVITPDGASPWGSPRARIDSTMIKAIARGFRWRKLLETGIYGTVEEIAKAEKINPSYVSRVLRMTLLAPAIVESILDGRQPAEMTLAVLMKPFPVGWREQVEAGFCRT
ncbi:MAG: Rrf2 family transcriptional regulator [Rhodospirillales bacterium]|nr:Rrf2 family transcriptional regulator [Rhodospirillales bacterium]